MTCAEFQSVLPFIIETGGNATEEEHLKTCKVCSDLVADLRYIAEQAKLLVPMEEPSRAGLGRHSEVAGARGPGQAGRIAQRSAGISTRCLMIFACAGIHA